MNEHIENRLRSARFAPRAPAGLTGRVRAAVRGEPQIPDRSGFEMRRVGPIAAAVFVGLAVIPFLIQSPPPPPVPARQSEGIFRLQAPISSYASMLDESYTTELAGLQADADRLAAAVLRSWQPFARN